MTKDELQVFLGSQMAQHVASFSFGYSQGQVDVDTPDRPITALEFRASMIAWQLAVVDAFESLGLVKDGAVD